MKLINSTSPRMWLVSMAGLHTQQPHSSRYKKNTDTQPVHPESDEMAAADL